MQDMYSGEGGLLFSGEVEEDAVTGFIGRTPPCPLDWSDMMWLRSSRLRSRRREMRVFSWAIEAGEVGGW